VYGGVDAGVYGGVDADAPVTEPLALFHQLDTDDSAPDVVSSPNPQNPPFIDLLLCFLGIYILLKEINI
jgi:hypothetical protein